jgi:hypothetical protein
VSSDLLMHVVDDVAVGQRDVAGSYSSVTVKATARGAVGAVSHLDDSGKHSMI